MARNFSRGGFFKFVSVLNTKDMCTKNVVLVQIFKYFPKEIVFIYNYSMYK